MLHLHLPCLKMWLGLSNNFAAFKKLMWLYISRMGKKKSINFTLQWRKGFTQITVVLVWSLWTPEMRRLFFYIGFCRKHKAFCKWDVPIQTQNYIGYTCSRSRNSFLQTYVCYFMKGLGPLRNSWRITKHRGLYIDMVKYMCKLKTMSLHHIRLSMY